MPEIFLNGRPVQAEDGQTVLQVALQHGVFIPYFCWHPALSVAGNCRICMVEVEGRGLDIACNMPVSEGMKVLTDSAEVRATRQAMLQFLTLNHPVDCGICDKAGECILQDHHFADNGRPSMSVEPKLRSTKLYELSPRLLLDNERCILCSRCVRFTHEVSGSKALGIVRRGERALVRPAQDRPFDDPYSDNLVDICPVGALLSRSFLHKSRVWFLQATPSVCPACARGCRIRIWHRKPEWHVQALDPQTNRSIARVTPLEQPEPGWRRRGNGDTGAAAGRCAAPAGTAGAAGAEQIVNGHWICNTGRDLVRLLARPRAEQAMLKGQPVELPAAIDAAGKLLGQAGKIAALASSWGSDEELAAFAALVAALGPRCTTLVKADRAPAPGEPLEDGLLIHRDKNPNSGAARARFGEAEIALAEGTELVLVWGEGFDFARLPAGARVILLGSWLQPENGHADVFVPLSIQTERSGHYTNFQGVVSAFSPCFAKRPTVAHAEELFAELAAAPAGGRP